MSTPPNQFRRDDSYNALFRSYAAFPMRCKVLQEKYLDFLMVYASGSQTVVRVPLVVRESLSDGSRATYLS